MIMLLINKFAVEAVQIVEPSWKEVSVNCCGVGILPA